MLYEIFNFFIALESKYFFGLNQFLYQEMISNKLIEVLANFLIFVNNLLLLNIYNPMKITIIIIIIPKIRMK